MLEELGFSLGFTTTIGVIMIVITLFIHRHTFIQDYELGHFRRLKLPIWLAFVIIVVGLIPFVNFAAFVIGAMVYLMRMTDQADFIFSFKNITGKYPEQTGGLGRKIKKFFNKNLS